MQLVQVPPIQPPPSPSPDPGEAGGDAGDASEAQPCADEHDMKKELFRVFTLANAGRGLSETTIKEILR